MAEVVDSANQDNQGLVLVFDLDQTLIDTNALLSSGAWDKIDFSERESAFINYNTIGPFLNLHLIKDVIKPALELRPQQVSAILLLTNNGNDTFVNIVCEVIRQKMRWPMPIFDSVMTRNSLLRDKSNDPPKSIGDVAVMMHNKGLNTEDLSSRVYFFDDRFEPHVIRSQLDNKDKQYIVIPSEKTGPGERDWKYGFQATGFYYLDFPNYKHVKELLEGIKRSSAIAANARERNARRAREKNMANRLAAIKAANEARAKAREVLAKSANIPKAITPLKDISSVVQTPLSLKASPTLKASPIKYTSNAAKYSTWANPIAVNPIAVNPIPVNPKPMTIKLRNNGPRNNKTRRFLGSVGARMVLGQVNPSRGGKTRMIKKMKTKTKTKTRG